MFATSKHRYSSLATRPVFSCPILSPIFPSIRKAREVSDDWERENTPRTPATLGLFGGSLVALLIQPPDSPYFIDPLFYAGDARRGGDCCDRARVSWRRSRGAGGSAKEDVCGGEKARHKGDRQMEEKRSRRGGFASGVGAGGMNWLSG